MKPLNLSIAFCFIAAFFLLSSCEKDKEKQQPLNYSLIAEDAGISETAFNDVFTRVDNESKNGQYENEVGKTEFSYNSLVDTCAIVTLNLNGGNFPMTLTIDFGSGCTIDYITRKGKIICTYTGHYRDSSSQVIITLENYYVDSFKVEGTQTITNTGRNADGNLTFSVEVTNGKVTKPDGGIVTWESERTNEWIEGESTILYWCDDVYQVTGYGLGTTSDGHDYRIDITSALEKQICCYPVTAGSVSLKVDGSEVATVDYGTGTCDYVANLNYGGQTYVIVIR